jgi:hypothetical protein
MPSRSDIDPVEILTLLPYLTIVERVDGQFRYRLVGTAVARQIGHDPTGSPLGTYVRYSPNSLAALHEVIDRIFRSARPHFVAGHYEPLNRPFHHFSALAAPLSQDGMTVNMIIYLRVARLDFNFTPGVDWLRGAPLRFAYLAEIGDIAELERLCLDWERHSLGNGVSSKSA